MSKKLLIGLAENLDWEITRAEKNTANAQEHGDDVSRALQSGHLAGLQAARKAMNEVDNDEGCYVFDRLDKYWREHGGTSREMDYAEAFANYLLAHMEVK